MPRYGRFGLTSYWRLFVAIDAMMLAIIYAVDGLRDPAYIRQGEIAPHWFYAVLLWFCALAAFATRYATLTRNARIAYALGWDFVGALYLLFAFSFWPQGPTAFATYLLISLFSFVHALGKNGEPEWSRPTSR